MHRAPGFTLPECLAVTVIIGVLTTVGIPAMTRFIDKQKADAAAYAIVRQLNSARKFAITSGRRVTFCGVDSSGVCTSTDMQHFAVFSDVAYDHRMDDGDIVYSHEEVRYPGTVHLRASNNRHITFNANGSARQFGSVLLCPKYPAPRLNRRVTVHRMGRPYLETEKNGAGVVENTGACGNY